MPTEDKKEKITRREILRWVAWAEAELRERENDEELDERSAIWRALHGLNIKLPWRK